MDEARSACIELTRIERGVARVDTDWVAREEPLEIRVEGRSIAVTMRTPGHDEELAAGFLLTEGIIEVRAQLAEIKIPNRGRNLISVKLAPGTKSPATAAHRYFAANSSCGVCGKASIDSVRARNIRPLN